MITKEHMNRKRELLLKQISDCEFKTPTFKWMFEDTFPKVKDMEKITKKNKRKNEQ